MGVIKGDTRSLDYSSCGRDRSKFGSSELSLNPKGLGFRV